MKNKITFIDLFAGIGGFHLAFHKLQKKYPNKCLFVSEIDELARETYETNFSRIDRTNFELLKRKNLFVGDIVPYSSENPDLIPNHDILCAGFPCQPFSQAGYKKGFQELKENRGNMFFEIFSILQAKKPKAFFLENVRHIINHDRGRTFQVIRESLQQLGYSFRYQVIKASDFNLPQHRPRVYMVGFKGETTATSKFRFPKPVKLKKNMSQIFNGKCDRDIGFTLRVGGRGSGIDDRRNWDAYRINGKVTRIGVEEGKAMMGFPKSFKFPVSSSTAMKQLGNSVAVSAIKATLENILFYLESKGKEPQGIDYEYEKIDIFN